MTPYYAVFGREATRAPLLERPALPASGPTGSVFLRTLHDRITDIHNQLYNQSHEIRLRRQELRNATLSSSRALATPLAPGDHVWIIYRSWEKAAYIRKHGKGAPWKRRYKVLEVRELYGVKLDVSADQRGILPWQPRRRITKASDDEHDHGDHASQLAGQGASGQLPYQLPPRHRRRR